ncbi:MAG: class I SAM-dependent methyltransferase [Desulfuromonadaceae bacterium]|nr:class I SAM-dependent methyltransferase [Desulfuromonadaceae bacterium]MDD2847677.1 class I SAM-dependent methyltransferase [Desulfuromonadaceae bacterium]MDD4131077.1 class I SAM-dependent methyltransferase [Desulfuromonadaceae bacterium]
MTQKRDFNAVASKWDEEPRRVKLAGEITEAIIAAIPPSTEWDALDFGCGTGLVTLQLAPNLRSMTGTDSSSGMIDRLGAKILDGGFSNVRAELCNLESGNLPSGRYHLITSAMTLHHIPEIVPLLRSLKTLLHPGGWIALADLESEGGRFHEDPTGVFHQGFSANELSTMLAEAGFSSISVTTATKVVKGDQSFPVLLATAQSL